MHQSGDYITADKKKSLEEELNDLKGAKRKEVLEALAYAKSLGDLKENAEYHQAREDQNKLEERIAKVEQILQSCQVVSGGGGETVTIGSKVTVQKEGEAECRLYTIVGSEEADMQGGKISNHSPLGQAMFGKRTGDTVSFETPRGTVNYKIISLA